METTSKKVDEENCTLVAKGDKLLLEILRKIIFQNEEIDEFNDLLEQSVYKQVLEEFKQDVMDLLNKAGRIKKSWLFQQLLKSASKHNDLCEEECLEMAWEERRFLLKKFIRDNQEEIQDLFDSVVGEDDDDSKNDDDDDDDDDVGVGEDETTDEVEE